MIQQSPRKCIFLNLGVILSLLLGCSQLNGESPGEFKMLEGRLLYEYSKEPLADVEMSLFKLNKPLFSMRGWEKIAAAKTDKNGRFLFKFSEPGPYEVRWNPESDIISHEFSVKDFEGKKSIEILHRDKEEKVYPWDKKKP